MQKTHHSIRLAAMLLLTGVALASALEVKLSAKDDANVARQSGVATFGVPFAKGAVPDLKKLSVAVGGKTVPAQFIKLAAWDDGSIRWALTDCQLPVAAGGATELIIRDDGKNVPPPTPVKVGNTADAITVSTGPLQFTIGKKHFNLFKSIKVDGKELVTGAGKGLVIHKVGGGSVTALPPEKVLLERKGPLHVSLCLKGKYPEVHQGLMSYTVRLDAYAGQKFIKMRAWLENNGQHGYTTRNNKPPYKPEWYHFDGMDVDLGLGLGPVIKAACEGVEAGGKFKVYQYCKNAPHYSKPPAYGYTMMEYTIKGADKELKKDKITDGVVALSGEKGKATVAIRHFWENYEKAIELNGQSLRLQIFPKEGLWPRAFFQHACPGYARGMIEPLRKKDGYNIPGSVHKSAEMILDFSGRPPAESSAELSHPLFPLASAEYYAATDTAPVLFTPPDIRATDDECNAKLDAWMRMTQSVADPKHASSIWTARKGRQSRGNNFGWGYFYGWMDFGDLAVPGSGTVSLHYGWPLIMLLDTMRTGDLNYLRLATEMMRHRTEVDQQWSDRALKQYHGFSRAGHTYAQFHCARFTRGGPSVTGVDIVGPILYYLMTGDVKTLEAVNRCSKSIAPAWERIFASEDYGTRQVPGNMGAVGQTIHNYMALYQLTADKQWLEKAKMMFTKCVIPKWKNAGPHLHAREQIRSQGYTRDDIRYCYTIHVLCMLHHLTKDEKLFELLQSGADEEFPENFFDAPLFLADLSAYVALYAEEDNDTYVDNATEFWIQGFPESKCPPVYMPNNSQWSRRKAMWLRAGHLLQYYFWKKKKK